MRRWRRIARVSLLPIFLVLVLLAGAWRYFGATYLADLVSRRLTEESGLPVRIATARLGLTGLAFYEITVKEKDAGPAEDPWITAPRIDADLTLWDVVQGVTMPRSVALRQPQVLLRFDADDRLLTRMPTRKRDGPLVLPPIAATDAELTLRKAGRADMVVRGIDLALAPGETLALSGTVVDPYWGDWNAAGTIDASTLASQLVLTTKSKIHIGQEKLTRIPFIPLTVWRQVELDGTSPVQLTLDLKPEVPGVKYRVLLEPEDTHVHVASIDLTAKSARGKVAIEDHHIELTDVRGRTASGGIETNGVLDFRGATSVLLLGVRVQRVDLHDLPKRWSLPARIAGKLSGQAKLRVDIANGSPRTSGDGVGDITETRIGGLPALPIHLKLHADGLRFHFTPSIGGGGVRSLQTAALATLADAPLDTERGRPREDAGE